MSEKQENDFCIRPVRYSATRHKSLLLLADPEEAVIETYIHDSMLYEYVEHDSVFGVAATLDLPDGSIELKNIAVLPDIQRRGVGSAMLKFICRKASGRRLIVGTADVSCEALAFYEQNGFVRFDIIPNFFINNYTEPVFDKDKRCTDMILLELKGNSD